VVDIGISAQFAREGEEERKGKKRGVEGKEGHGAIPGIGRRCPGADRRKVKKKQM